MLAVVIFATAKAGPVCNLIMCASFVGFGTTEDVILSSCVLPHMQGKACGNMLVLACVGEDAHVGQCLLRKYLRENLAQSLRTPPSFIR